jgi:hypothetical protein
MRDQRGAGIDGNCNPESFRDLLPGSVLLSRGCRMVGDTAIAPKVMATPGAMNSRDFASMCLAFCAAFTINV